MKLEEYYKQPKTRTSKTEVSYLKRIKQIESSLEDNEEQLTPMAMVDWLVNKKKDYTYSTFRQYKSALIYYFEKHIRYQDYQIALEHLKNIKQEGCKNDKRDKNQFSKETELKTSSLKIKKVKDEDLLKIKEQLYQSKSIWQKRAFSMFECSIYLGLRPSEWEFADLLEIESEEGSEEKWLKIKNGKNTNGRANGKFRFIQLDEELYTLAKNLIEDIKLFLEKDTFEHYYQNSRLAFKNLMKKTFPLRKKHYSLYSARHQFSANQKNIHSQKEVADLMGHKSKRTASIHYGKKRSGWKQFMESKENINEKNKVKPIII